MTGRRRTGSTIRAALSTTCADASDAAGLVRFVEALEKMDLAYPVITPAQRAELASAREALLAG